MQLENLAVVVRPRTVWEACDLGVQMARKWYKPLLLVNFSITLPFIVLTHFTLFYFPDYLWTAPLLFWWTKPLWERSQLSILSKCVFGQIPTIGAEIRKFPALTRKQFFQALFWRRFSLSRAFTAPISQLETLGGRARRDRISVLNRDGRVPIRSITLIGVHIESFVLLSVYLLGLVLVPTEFNESMSNFIFELDDRISLMINSLIYCLVIIVVMPFYVATGFSLYLNRRAELEGWDIEIAFKKLAKTISAKETVKASGARTSAQVISLLLLIATASAALSYSPIATAAEGTYFNQNPSESKIIITEVLAGEPFHVMEETSIPELDWRRFFDFELQDNRFLEWLASWFSSSRDLDFSFVEVVLWVFVIGLVAVFLYRYRGWLIRFASPRQKNSVTVHREIPSFVSEGSATPMPDDIPGKARELWREGSSRAAIALLYQGALVRTCEKTPIPISKGNTEHECIAMINAYTNSATAEYFRILSLAWQRLAYGHLPLDEERFQSLCENWNTAIGNVANTGELQRE